MQKYRDFRPAVGDPRGAYLYDRQNWWVAPVSRTRGSDHMSESNFNAVLAELGGESDTIEVHRFGHWGPGWFEIIIIDPKAVKLVTKAEELEASLTDYPILDDEDYSNRVYEAQCEYWEHLSLAERMDYCHQADVSIFAARRDNVPNDVLNYLEVY